MKIRPALINDSKQIQALVNQYAVNGGMILLSMNDIYEKIFEYFLYEDDDGSILGVCALHPMWEDLAEIRSLAVRAGKQGMGIGGELVKAQLARAKQTNFKKAFTLTYKVDFFAKLGFTEVSKEDLPKKIWTDCLKCIKYPDCDETAMTIQL